MIDGVRINLTSISEYRKDIDGWTSINFTGGGKISLRVPVERLDQMIRECSCTIKGYSPNES
jgi:hypothetical protein